MYQLSTKGRYGTRFLYQLAKNHGNGPMALRQIAKNEDLPVKYLEQIIPIFKKAKLITSVRGPHGGYLLLKEPSEINIKTVLELLEGNLSPVGCLISSVNCKRSRTCAAQTVWRELEKKIHETLRDITLLDMLNMSKNKE